MTTTFHFETNEPQYEYSYEGADVQLRCEGLVAVAAGPAPSFDENVPRTWFELSPVSGKRILAGVGRSVPSATASSAFETREAMWANAMAGLAPLELAETSTAVAGCVYALVDPANGRVELGRAGDGITALIIAGGEIRLVQPALSESGVGRSASFELSTGSALLLLTHEATQREALTSAIQGAITDCAEHGHEVDTVLGRCLELRNGPLSQCESIVALSFERLDGSPVMRTPFDPPLITGEVLHADVFATRCTSKLRIRRTECGRRPCRSRPHWDPGRHGGLVSDLLCPYRVSTRICPSFVDPLAERRELDGSELDGVPTGGTGVRGHLPLERAGRF